MISFGTIKSSQMLSNVISSGVGSGGNSLLVPPSCLSSHNSPGT